MHIEFTCLTIEIGKLCSHIGLVIAMFGSHFSCFGMLLTIASIKDSIVRDGTHCVLLIVRERARYRALYMYVHVSILFMVCEDIAKLPFV